MTEHEGMHNRFTKKPKSYLLRSPDLPFEAMGSSLSILMKSEKRTKMRIKLQEPEKKKIEQIRPVSKLSLTV